MRWLDVITDSIDMKFEQALGVGDGQESLHAEVMGSYESDTTEQLN